MLIDHNRNCGLMVDEVDRLRGHRDSHGLQGHDLQCHLNSLSISYKRFASNRGCLELQNLDATFVIRPNHIATTGNTQSLVVDGNRSQIARP